MEIKRRVFISAPKDKRLTVENRAIKNGIRQRIEKEGYQLEEFFISGEGLGWSFDNVEYVVSKCAGAIVMAFPNWSLENDNMQFPFTSESVHYEGAIVNAHNIPLLIICDGGVERRGITDLGGGKSICFKPENATAEWLNDSEFTQPFLEWKEKLKQRYDVFFGYCNQAEATANKIYIYLEKDLGLNVLNWKINFTPGQSILQEIEKAAKECTGAIFLFTKDDALGGTEDAAAPRDNVVFEAGFFIQAKGKDKVLIIREEGAKMPADLGGDLYLKLENKEQTALIETDLRKFVQMRL